MSEIDASGYSLGALAASDVCGLGDAVPVDSGVVDDGMVLRVGDQLFQVGHTGVADASVTLADDRGLSIFSDRDGDGAVDHVTTILFDGSYETWEGEPPRVTPGAEECERTEVGLRGQESAFVQGVNDQASGPSGAGEYADSAIDTGDLEDGGGADQKGVDVDAFSGVGTAGWDASMWERIEIGRWG
ncbi:hypothetical protein KRX51_09040 [Corynebacterium sp. TAE3-ERU12]|uniref:DUF6802 family protein n=1 Tax=Corynebacterium sp. TAE3-ERU12 TaxID=2849491 RepID=UPI001C486C36|nr:DUF6802 family protein [Corynebacterium sp. TAE3-ERU12]MBV7296053.1 hypothetical protein [Corynebacterium sp. TAE3-ERU12]